MYNVYNYDKKLLNMLNYEKQEKVEQQKNTKHMSKW